MKFAGIDIGSTGIKVSVYDESGNRIGYGYEEHAIHYDNRKAVMDVGEWKDGLTRCMGQVLRQTAVDDIAAIGISGCNSIILTDENDVPVAPALMQLDKHGYKAVGIVKEELGEDNLLEKTGNGVIVGFQWGTTLKWLQLYKPETLRKAKKIYNPTSFIVSMLTGAYCMDFTRAITTSLLDYRRLQWDDGYWEYFGLNTIKKPVVKKCTEVVGVTRNVLGFPAGIPVIAGAIDTICAQLGLTLGRKKDVLIMGSVGRFASSVEKWDKLFLNTLSWDGITKISMTPVNNAGTAMKWLKSAFYGDSTSYQEIDKSCEGVLPGSEGLTFLPYLNGAGCPRWADHMQATFYGIKAQHRTEHFANAVMEGVAFTLRENMEQLRTSGLTDCREIFLGGGGAKSRVWTSILANVLNRELVISKELETETLGAALMAAFAVNKVTMEEAECCWNKVIGKVVPQPEISSKYNELYRQFISDNDYLDGFYRNRIIQ